MESNEVFADKQDMVRFIESSERHEDPIAATQVTGGKLVVLERLYHPGKPLDYVLACWVADYDPEQGEVKEYHDALFVGPERLGDALQEYHDQVQTLLANVQAETRTGALN